MKALRLIAVAALALAASAQSFATDFPLGTLSVPSVTNLANNFTVAGTYNFTDKYSFTVTSGAQTFSIGANFNIAPQNGTISLSTMQLYVAGPGGAQIGSDITATVGGTFGNISNGNYVLKVNGNINNSNGLYPVPGYGGQLQLISAPEPGTLALFGLGLAGAGFAARRGRKSVTVAG